MDGFNRFVGSVITWSVWTGGTLATSALLGGYVLVKLWGWFVVPTFNNVPPIPLVAAIGIGLTMKYLTHQTSFSKEEKKTAREKFANFIRRLAFNGLVLLFGWIVSLFM